MSKEKNELEEQRANGQLEQQIASGQMEMFEAKYIKPPPPIKADSKSSSYALFSLQTKRKDMVKRTVYTKKDGPIKVLPSGEGIANMDDKKYLVYIVSQLVKGLQSGHSLNDRTLPATKDTPAGKSRQPPIQWVEINTSDLHKTVAPYLKDPSSFRRTLRKACRRLKGTQYEFEKGLKIGDELFVGNISFIGDFFLPKRMKGFHGKMYIQISPVIVRLVQSWGVLTYHRHYYGIKSPLMRRLYEIGRGRAGTKKRLPLGIEALYAMTGSTAAKVYTFRQSIEVLFEENAFDGVLDLLDYKVTFDQDKDQLIFWADEGFLERMEKKEAERFEAEGYLEIEEEPEAELPLEAKVEPEDEQLREDEEGPEDEVIF